MTEPSYQDMQKILRLAVAQSRLALDESATAIDNLSAAFLAMATEIESMDHLLQESANLPTDIRKTITEAIAEFRLQTQQGTMAFQFYDKFCQRMHHLMTTLAEMDELVGTGGMQDPAKWQALKDSVRNRYTMEQEHRLLDAIESGASPEEALAASQASQEEDIELF